MIRFGPSGNDVKFYEECVGEKSRVPTTADAPKWLNSLGLTAIEISFGRGVRMSQTMAETIGEKARQYGISVSVHAPYFINLASDDKERIKKSYGYIAACVKIAGQINASDGPNRVVVHLGSQCKLDRATAIENTKSNLAWVVEKLRADGFDNFLLCVETMGRYKAIGDYREICDICGACPCVIPTLDFGHINSWEQGELSKNPNRIGEIMDYCVNALGDKMQRPHIHFSAIVYTKAGEHTHTTLDDAKWAFPFEPLARYIKKHKLEPIVICESKEHMATDAAVLKSQFEKSV